MTRSSKTRRALCCGVFAMLTTAAFAQQAVDTTPSKKTIEDAAAEGCDGVSSVMRRCADQAAAAAKRDADAKSDDALTRSRAATKAAFDRRDQRARDDALKGEPPPVSTPVGDAQKLGGVEVTGKSDNPQSVEEVIQKALNPASASNGNGTTSRYAPNGSRYDCIEKCVGPACCVEVRSMPDPARNSNSIGH